MHGRLNYNVKPKELSNKDKKKFSENLEKNADNYILARHLDDFVFATARAVDVGDFYGKLGNKFFEHCVNANGDYFDYTEVTEINPIKKISRYKSFANRGFYRNHESDKIENAIGYVFDSVLNILNKNTIVISCLFGVDKQKAPDVARTLLTYPKTLGVSMGCTIKYSICTNCEAEIINNKKCECLAIYLNRRHPRTGNLVAELVKGVDFFELSGVTNPAFAFSYVLDVVKDWVPGRVLKVAKESGDSELLNMLNVLTYIKKNLKSATHTRKLVFNAKLDEIMQHLSTRFGLTI